MAITEKNIEGNFEIHLLTESDYQSEKNKSTFNKDAMYMITDSQKGLLDKFYPVGAVFITADDSFNPSSSFGGKWEKISGRFLIGSGNNTDEENVSRSFTTQTTGGSYSHTLTKEQLPYSEVNFKLRQADPTIKEGWTAVTTIWKGNESDTNITINDKYSDPSTTPLAYSINGNLENSNTTTTFVSVNNGGENQPYSILPPYLVINIWKRIL